jgi:hypothetical protein
MVIPVKAGILKFYTVPAFPVMTRMGYGHGQSALPKESLPPFL